MKKNKVSPIKMALLLFVVLLGACNDAWDEHYTNSAGTKSNLNLFQLIKTKPELSSFAAMLEVTGYDSILSQPQTYTVWAPVNEALSGSENWDIARKTEIVRNHITRFSHPTSGLESKTIFMLDKKFISFSKTATGFSLGGKNLISDLSNIAAANGVLHAIDGYVPYLNNIWEFIGYAQHLDSLRAYLYAQSKFEFDQEASVEIGTNDHGQAIYDSVITFKNEILDQIGHLHVEDSVYTALLPDNNAWTKAYNLIKNGYKTLPADGGLAQQRLNTQWAVVRNLIFRNKVNQPELLDVLESTTGTVFNQPAYLFENVIKTELSNGLVYLTDSIRFKAAESWQQPIRVEAENSDYGRSYKFANLYVRSGLGSAYSAEISDGKFLVAEPTTVSNTTQNEITFPIPNTLSGNYRIYCVFVPSNIVSADDVRPNKVSFYLSYINSTGAVVTESTVSSKNLLLGPGKVAGIFTSEGDKMTKMFVTEFAFPFCNLIKDKSEAANITVKLRVRNEVKITETVKFNKTLRIDHIILEPVQ